MTMRIPPGFTTVKEQAGFLRGKFNNRQRAHASRLCRDRFIKKFGEPPQRHQLDRTKKDSWDDIYPNICIPGIKTILTEVLNSVDNQTKLF